MRCFLALLGWLACSPVAGAYEISSSWTLASQWVDRGVSQTAGEPALQGSLDVALESGAYLGIGGSNIDFGVCCPEWLQLDGYLGFAKQHGDWRWDAGLTRSTFVGARSDADFSEYHFGLDWRSLGFRASWTPDFADLGREAWYLELNGAFALRWQEMRLLLHVGYTHGAALQSRFAEATALEPYGDWQLALGRDLGRFSVTLAWADTDMGGPFRVRDKAGMNDGRLVLAVSTIFHW
jgi:uncharacterized protein (TIGR02001 family)